MWSHATRCQTRCYAKVGIRTKFVPPASRAFAGPGVQIKSSALHWRSAFSSPQPTSTPSTSLEMLHKSTIQSILVDWQILRSSTWGSYLSLIQSAHTILFFWVRTMASDLVGLILIQPTSYSAANGLSASHCLMKQGELHHLRKILSPPHLTCSTFHLMTEPRNSVFKNCD